MARVSCVLTDASTSKHTPSRTQSVKHTPEQAEKSEYTNQIHFIIIIIFIMANGLLRIFFCCITNIYLRSDEITVNVAACVWSVVNAAVC
jgi:hypothetical protein